jgi:hypothetical protein
MVRKSQPAYVAAVVKERGANVAGPPRSGRCRAACRARTSGRTPPGFQNRRAEWRRCRRFISGRGSTTAQHLVEVRIALYFSAIVRLRARGADAQLISDWSQANEVSVGIGLEPQGHSRVHQL